MTAVLTLPSHPPDFGTLIPTLKKPSHLVSVGLIFVVAFDQKIFKQSCHDLFNWGFVLFHPPPLNERQEEELLSGRCGGKGGSCSQRKADR